MGGEGAMGKLPGANALQEFRFEDVSGTIRKLRGSFRFWGPKIYGHSSVPCIARKPLVLWTPKTQESDQANERRLTQIIGVCTCFGLGVRARGVLAIWRSRLPFGHGSKSCTIPIPTKIGSKMGGEFTYQPKMGSQNGFDNRVF